MSLSRLVAGGVALFASAAAAQESATCSGETAAALPSLVASPASRWPDLALLVVVIAIAALGILLVRANERRRRQSAVAGRGFEATPYWTGAALGAVFALSLLLLRHPVGASGAFLSLAGLLARHVAPGTRYFEEVIPPGMTFGVWVVLGVLAGSAISSVAARRFRPTLVAEGWAALFGPSPARRLLVAFAGGIVIELAAGIAGGCTSGLALSGGIVLAPGAFLFMAAMFATGIPTARLAEHLGGTR